MSEPLSMSIHNATARSRIVMLEPWAREFLMDVNEKLEIVAWPGPGGVGLRVVETHHLTLVFVEGCFGVRVIKEGMTHNLELEAAEAAPAPRPC